MCKFPSLTQRKGIYKIEEFSNSSGPHREFLRNFSSSVPQAKGNSSFSQGFPGGNRGGTLCEPPLGGRIENFRWSVPCPFLREGRTKGSQGCVNTTPSSPLEGVVFTHPIEPLKGTAIGIGDLKTLVFRFFVRKLDTHSV
jgi:hypothetical protein